jgi:hypothetical protein
MKRICLLALLLGGCAPMNMELGEATAPPQAAIYWALGLTPPVNATSTPRLITSAYPALTSPLPSPKPVKATWS